ncbi:hypothetical protein [Methanobacterium alcaliphilum]|uniref:hypothetical protein n=1 Tax=Methanobacterium alcaliphilum TaxID=392018 RepID=UPI00200B13F7|nr:hypothetical protein [Methanobacterium alcaliphilum]MCK9150539.1 hypothetical protein [Methanobacterium alcaliphilum]
MNKKLKVFLFGFLAWLIPFAVSFIIFPLKESMRPLFESIMPLVLSITVIILTYYYLKKISSNFIKEGILIGIIWYVINIVIDLFLFMPESPMHMSFGDYMMDIGLTYLIIPVITIGMGYMANYGD